MTRLGRCQLEFEVADCDLKNDQTRNSNLLLHFSLAFSLYLRHNVQHGYHTQAARSV